MHSYVKDGHRGPFQATFLRFSEMLSVIKTNFIQAGIS